MERVNPRRNLVMGVLKTVDYLLLPFLHRLSDPVLDGAVVRGTRDPRDQKHLLLERCL